MKNDTHGRAARRSWRFTVPAALAVLAFTMFAGSALADATWEGVDWTGPAVLAGDNLVVTNDGSNFPAAHHNTPGDFRIAPVQSVTFSFIDTGPGTVGGGVLLEDDDAGALTTFGVVPGQAEYRIFRLGDGGLNQEDTTGVTRTAGEHTFQVVKLADGTIDYVLDGVLVFSSGYFGIDKFGDVYLRARGGSTGDTVTYTAYAAETSYQRPAPPSNFNFAWFFGNCEPQNEVLTAQSFGFGCRGFGLFFGDYTAASLAAAVQAEAYEEFGAFNTVVVRLHAFKIGAPFVAPIQLSQQGSCNGVTPLLQADQLSGLTGGLWIAWFTIEICDTVVAPT